MKAFVTGGTGFVGSHLTEKLISSPEYKEVRCLVRSSDKWLSGQNFTRINGDLFSLQEIGKALEGIDVLFHIAGLTKAPTEKEFNRANVDATEDLIRIAQKKNVKNIVVLSSLAAVGPSSGSPLDEKAAMKPVSNYGKSKMKMEQVIHQIAKNNDSIKILRPPAVYGPRESDIYSFFKAFSSGICPIIGDGNHPKLSLVYVDDLVNGIMKAADNHSKGVHTYFIGGNENVYSWNEIRRVTSIVMGRKAIPLKIKPHFVSKLSAVVEGAASLFGKYPVLNKEKAKELVLEWVCSSDKAIKELNYQPKMPLPEGISRTIHWYKKHNWL